MAGQPAPVPSLSLSGGTGCACLLYLRQQLGLPGCCRALQNKVVLELCPAVYYQSALCPLVQDLRLQAEESGQHIAGLAGNGLAGACTPLALHPAEGGHHSHITAALEAQQHSLTQLQRLKGLLNEELAALGEATWLSDCTGTATCSRCQVHAAAGQYKC